MIDTIPLAVLEIDPYDDRVFSFYNQNYSNLRPKSEYTADDYEFLEFFKQFIALQSLYRLFVSKEQEPVSRYYYPEGREVYYRTPVNYPWYIEDWAASSPAYASLLEARKKATRYDLGLRDDELLPYWFSTNATEDIGVPPAGYFAFTTESLRRWNEVSSIYAEFLKKSKTFTFEFGSKEAYYKHPPGNATPSAEQIRGYIYSRATSLQLDGRCAIALTDYLKTLHPELTFDEILRTFYEMYGIKYILQGVYDFDLIKDPFWAWVNTSTAEFDQPDLFSIGSTDAIGRVLRPGAAPGSPGCPPEFPSAWAERRSFELIATPNSIDRVSTTIVNEYTVTIPPNVGVRIDLNSPYAGALLAQFQAQPPGVFDPPETSTTVDTSAETTTVGDTTTVVTKPISAVYEVRQYRFGPHRTGEGRVGGIINRPFLQVRLKSGTVPATQMRDMKKKAESMAKQKLMELWGFIPAWVNNYGGTVEEYVMIHTGRMDQLPYYNFFRDSASLEEKPKFRDYDWVMPYAFDVVVTENPYGTTTTTTSTTTTTTVTETVETMEEREPITYTFTDTETQESLKVTVTLSFAELPPEADRYILTPDVERATGAYVLLSSGIASGGFWDGSRHIYFLIPKRVDPESYLEPYGYKHFSDLVNYVYSFRQLAGFYRYYEYDEETYEETTVEDPGYTGIPTLPFETWAQLTKELFYPGRSILQYLPSLHSATLLETVQAIDSYYGQLPGGSYLNQYGSAAPLFPVFQESLVLDTQLNKWGKFSSPHSCLADLAPINSHRNRKVNPQNFTMHAAMLSSDGFVYQFNEKPQDSEIRYGKVGYHRLGFTNLEELRVWFAKASSGFIQIEPSLQGAAPEVSLTQETPFANSLSQVAYSNSSARWYNITIKGQYDIKGIEFVGLKSSRR